jgi:tetratricopeptide (TPR) repeat protein
MSYLRENGLRIALIVVILIVLSPSAFPHAMYESIEEAQSALLFGRLDQALQSLEEVRSFEPATLGLRQSELIIALRLGLWDDAERHLRILENLWPNSDEITCSRLQLDLARDRYTTDTQNDAPSLSSCPGVETALHRHASELFNAGDFESALPLFENLIAYGTESRLEQTMYALYVAATDPSNAVDLLREAQNGQNSYSRLALKLLIIIQDNQDSQAPAYLSAQLGQAFLREGEWNLALKSFENAVFQNPEFAQAWGYLGTVKNRIGLDGGEDIEEAIRLAPNDPIILVLQATYYNAQAEPELALPLLELAAKLDPENPAVASELGQTYILLGELESAEMAFRQATFLAPDEPSFWNLLANFSLRYEIDIDLVALPALRNSLILEPDSIESLRSLGYAYHMLGNPLMAKRALNRAVVLSPTDPTTQYFLGLHYQAQGLPDKAIAAWIAARNFSPQHPYSLMAMRALENLGIHH